MDLQGRVSDHSSISTRSPWPCDMLGGLNQEALKMIQPVTLVLESSSCSIVAQVADLSVVTDRSG